MKYLMTNRNNKYLEFSMMRWFIFRVQMLTTIISTFNQVVIIFFFSGNIAFAGLLFQYSQLLDMDVFFMIDNIVYFESQFVSYERVNQFTRIQCEEGFNEESKKRYEEYPLKPSEEWPSSGKIEFNGVSARYRKDLPLVLSDISFKVESGEKIGIVGRTGAGKSTLINVFYRILEAVEGSVVIDGLDIHKVDLDKVRRCFTLIS